MDCRSRRLRTLAGLVSLATSLLGGSASLGQTLQVGAAAAPLGIEAGVQLVGVPLAGYGGRKGMPDVLGLYPFAHYFPPGREARSGEDIRAKAFVIERDGEKLAFISLDMVGVDREFRGMLAERLALPPFSFEEEALIVSATHTHSGPGALSGNHFFEFSATDRLHTGLRASMVDQIVDVVRAAASNAVEAKLYLFNTDVDCNVNTTWTNPGECLHKNRSREKHYADHRLSVLAARNSSDEWIGAMINFPVHGTAYRDDNDQLSSDYPGALERAFAKAMVSGSALDPVDLPVLFLNGAEGDVTPTYSLPDQASKLDDFASDKWGSWWATDPLPITIDEPWDIDSPEVELGHPFLYLRSELKPLHDSVPFSLLGIELETYFPTKARIWSFALGNIRFLSVPGEPTTDVGLALRKVAAEHGYENAWILGLTNDHLGYFTSPDDWALAEYEAGSSAYGAFGARRLVNQHSCLLPTPP